jgi:hypothetical protein
MEGNFSFEVVVMYPEEKPLSTFCAIDVLMKQ